MRPEQSTKDKKPTDEEQHQGAAAVGLRTHPRTIHIRRRKHYSSRPDRSPSLPHATKAVTINPFRDVGQIYEEIVFTSSRAMSLCV